MRQKTEPNTLLENYRHASLGSWFPVLQEALDEIIDNAIASNAPFSKHLAITDLMLSIARQRTPTFRQAAKRWKWSISKSRSLFTEIGLLAHRKHTTCTQHAHNAHTKNAVSLENSADQHTTRTQHAHNTHTTRTHDYYIESEENKSRREPARKLASRTKTESPGDAQRLSKELSQLLQPSESQHEP